MIDPRPIPDAFAVERLCVVMAASVGIVWGKLDHDSAARMRVMANAALLQLGIEAQAAAPRHLEGSVQDAAEALRTAAAICDHHKEREPTIQKMHRAAQNMEVLAGILSRVEAEEAV